MFRAPIANAVIFSVLVTVIAAGAMLLVIVAGKTSGLAGLLVAHAGAVTPAFVTSELTYLTPVRSKRADTLRLGFLGDDDQIARASR